MSKSAGVTTAGATWKFSGTETIAITPGDPSVEGESSCVQLKGTQVGPAKLTVEASGKTQVIEINFVKQTNQSGRAIHAGSAVRLLGAASAGERAGDS